MEEEMGEGVGDGVGDVVRVGMAELVGRVRAGEPYGGYAELRARADVVGVGDGVVAVLGFGEAEKVLRGGRFGHAEPEVIAEAGDPADPDVPVDGEGRVVRAFVFLNPPAHTRLRRVVGKAFTARTVEGLRPRVEELVGEFVERVVEAREVDLMGELAVPLPVTVIAELLGVPVADRERFGAWSGAMARAGDPAFLLPPGVAEAAAAARREFVAYFRELAAERRKKPREDLLSELVAGEGERLSEGELLVTLTLLLVAGHETTTNLIGNGMLALLRNPEQYATLGRDASLVDGAVEEILRYDSPIQLAPRTVLADTELGGVELQAGTSVLVLVGAANRDPREYDDPDRFDIRRPVSRHLAFGRGIHFCLGAPLARMEGRIVLRELAKRLPALRLAGEPERADTVTLRGLRTLPVAVG
ncbi:cytochrome P450 [Amycolatopsis rhabdoformis]|uniref:Cytochrome P450 n=1 Tax=Amycolatopsis rhabdoformis TaxID=1448059 RepID=A0ABZ1I5T6_9PSEU|nr:cytochrome P450 [Amycolatopsis rhabdoformis]WSE29645.1 cytochrome P450 [Amycolatopsis rhabdoformis]